MLALSRLGLVGVDVLVFLALAFVIILFAKDHVSHWSIM